MFDNDDPVVLGERFDGVGRQARTLPAGRCCAHMDCETRLSIYNPSSYCALHQDEIPKRGRSDGVRARSRVATTRPQRIVPDKATATPTVLPGRDRAPGQNERDPLLEVDHLVDYRMKRAQ